jgi:prepilin-type N-terminal cleavage/methylation domain-containing protein
MHYNKAINQKIIPMSTNRFRGFTLIELLVVIAIIGVLSSVVLASLNTARVKGSDAAIKSSLQTVRTQAELYYDTGSRYGSAAVAGVDCGATFTASTMLADSTITQALTSVKNNNGSVALYCNVPAAGTGYAIATALRGGGWYCIDSTGASKSTQGTGSTAYTAISGAATAALTDSSDVTCN